MAKDAKYEMFKKVVFEILSIHEEEFFLEKFTRIAADVDCLSVDEDKEDSIFPKESPDVEAFNKLNLTQKGELLKRNPEKYRELLALSKK